MLKVFNTLKNKEKFLLIWLRDKLSLSVILNLQYFKESGFTQLYISYNNNNLLSNIRICYKIKDTNC